jgi:hypothetical protein
MSPLPPPPKINPSALALGSRMGEYLKDKASQSKLGQIPLDADGVHRPSGDRRDVKVPAGMKKVYKQAPPHQGSKEMARRAKQLEREKKS